MTQCIHIGGGGETSNAQDVSCLVNHIFRHVLQFLVLALFIIENDLKEKDPKIGVVFHGLG